MSYPKNVILQFSASFCQPCKTATKYIESVGCKDKVHYIDVTESDNELLGKEYNVKNVPTFILLDINGKEVERFTGFDKIKLDNLLRKL